MILPDGGLGKCEHYVDETLGNIRDGWTDKSRLQAYKMPRCFEHCANCELQPGCYHIAACDTDHECTGYDYEDRREGAHLAVMAAYKMYQ